jgi:hypothetical protein
MESIRHHVLQSIAVVSLFSIITMAQAPAPARADHSMQAEEITQIIRDFVSGQKVDPALFKEFYAEDATFIGSRGRVYDKSEISHLLICTAAAALR